MTNQTAIGDSTAVEDETFVRLSKHQRQQEHSSGTEIGEAVQPFDLRGINLSHMLLSREPSTLQAVAWMDNFFTTVGDAMPNKREIHLEKTEKKTIYDIMVRDHFSEAPVSYSVFCRIWKTHFGHVKIREFKAVSGKCQFCAVLSDIRSTTQRREIRQRVTDLHAMHRWTYMSERLVYYTKTVRAFAEPDACMSIIMDGMAQIHTELPYLGNMTKFPNQISMKLVGCIEHGQSFTMYRTFGNVMEDANLAITCLLMQLETRMKTFGKLPPTVYIQVDGGSENVNKYVMCICEMLVARRLTKQICLTRLPVGHTHEDIDAKFGRLWLHVRNKNILSPQLQEVYMRECFRSGLFDCKNIYFCADYKSLLEAHADPHFANYSKEETTQLAWKFEAVPRSRVFPLGVRTMYRAYAGETVYELQPDVVHCDFPEVPFKAAKLHCDWQPKAEGQIELGVPADGMSILQRLPVGPIIPAAFRPGHASEFNKCIATLAEPKWRAYSVNSSGVRNMIAHWNDFAKVYPNTDSAHEYLYEVDFDIPMKGTLFDYLHTYVEGKHAYQAAMVVSDPPQCSDPSMVVDSTNVWRTGTAVSDVEERVGVVSSTSMPSVRWRLSAPAGEIPPRVQLTTTETLDLVEGKITLEQIRTKRLRDPLTIDQIRKLTVAELIARLKARTIQLLIASINNDEAESAVVR